MEGEALGVAWGFKKARHFLEGCLNLWVRVDHKPLLGLYSPDKALADIENHRLRRVVEKAAQYKFTAFHVPGTKNLIADGMSRAPVGEAEHMMVSNVQGALEKATDQGGAWLAVAGWKKNDLTTEEQVGSDELLEDQLDGAEGALYALAGDVMGIRVLTLDEVRKETAKDNQMVEIMELLATGDPPTQHLGDMRRHWASLSVMDGILLYGDRIFVPPALRKEVLATLHAGHQGVSSMMARAGHSLWWPGLGAEVERTRDRCLECDRNAPSQQKEPPAPLPDVVYPFQRVCADYFSLKGSGYLVLVDRYSGWPIVHQAKVASTRELLRVLRDLCVTYGVPEELSSDGGPQFDSEEMRDFCATWGINQRISSAYFPHSNTRAEVGVKTVKRMLRDNLGQDGSVDTVKFARALLEYRNTPDRDTGMSPAQVVFGRQIRDFVPVKPGKYETRKDPG